MFDPIMTLSYIACCGVGLIRGYHKAYLAIALTLALSFQHLFDFSGISKLIVAAIMAFYFLLPARSKETDAEADTAPPPKSKAPDTAQEDIETVFREFNDLSGKKRQSKTKKQRARQ